MHSHAILRAPAPSLAEGERTHLGRAPIDFPLALTQHAAYAAALHDCSVAVTVLPALPHHPDACFVEDTAIILPELSVLTRPGAPSRADEPAAIAPHLPADRPTARLPDGRLDGGDVLVAGKLVLVGLSSRTDVDGATALADQLAPHGYRVETIPMPAALHLKTAMTALGSDTLVVNRGWVPEPPLGMRVIDAQPSEPFGANLLWVNGHAFAQAAAPRTAELVARAGFDVSPLDISEFAKAEAGLTCLSLLVPGVTRAPPPR